MASVKPDLDNPWIKQELDRTLGIVVFGVVYASGGKETVGEENEKEIQQF